MAVSFTAEQALSPELGRGERLLWSGVPRQGVRLRPSDAYLIPFSLMWGGFAIFWESSVFSTRAPVFFELWGVPFVLVGLYLIGGRFITDKYQRTRTYYGVTDQRVIIVSGFFTRGVKSLTLQGLYEMSVAERSDRSGTITFGPSNPAMASWPGATWSRSGRTVSPAFELLDGVRPVYELIREAQQARLKLAENRS